MGISPEAVRARLSRGTLPKEKGPDGAVYVLLATDQTNDHTQSNGDRTVDQSGTVEVLQDQIDYLREQLDQERQARTEERRRHDTLMAQLMQRIPELEAPRDDPGATETASETSGSGDVPPEPEKRSWWRRFFGV